MNYDFRQLNVLMESIVAKFGRHHIGTCSQIIRNKIIPTEFKQVKFDQQYLTRILSKFKVVKDYNGRNKTKTV